ncbi:transmembrane protein 275-like [Pungitius pungitius]|uniref:transmembrane protein 275-like n=1 Tax=Pungitius pungitius TaxID=134920 RepID=UPI002E121DF3
MVLPENPSGPSAPTKAPRGRAPLHRSVPSPALCCACGLCILLAGINITLVGAFAYGTIVPAGNPPIVLGPLLLLVALAFFAACCAVSRRPPARRPDGGEKWGLMRVGAAAFEMETSDHMLQDATTAVQLSPADSPTSSSLHGGDPTPPTPTPPPPPAAGELHTSEMSGVGTTLTSGPKGSRPTETLPAPDTSCP